MNLNCTSRSIKYLMFLFNFLFVITGIALIAVGATIKAKYMQYDTFLDNKYFTLPNLLIATGILIFLISFLGCYGAIKESWVILMLFSVLLGVIFVFEFAAGIAGYVLRDKTSAYLERTFYNSMKDYNYTTNKPVTKMWDTIQSEFQCCGVKGPADWNSTLLDESLPTSCCPPQYGTIGTFHCNAAPKSTSVTISSTQATTQPTEQSTNATEITVPSMETSPASTKSTVKSENSPDSIPTASALKLDPSTTTPYNTGCEEAFGKFVKAHAIDIGAVGFAFAIIQIIGIGFSFHLARQLKNQYYST